MKTDYDESSFCRTALIIISTALVAVLLAGCVTVPSNESMTKDLFLKGDLDAAISVARKEIKENPSKRVESWYWMGRSYFQKGQYDDTIHAFSEMLKLSPPRNDKGWALFYMGRAHYFKNEHDEAISCFNRELEMFPSDELGLLGRGWAHFGKGFYEEAVKDADAAIAAGAKGERVRNAYRIKAFSYLALGQTEKVVQMIRRAEEADPNYLSLSDIIPIYFGLGGYQKVKAYLSRKGFLGVEVRDYNKNNLKAVEVVSVSAGYPAEKGGLLKGDLILRMNAKNVENMVEFIKTTLSTKPGSSVNLEIVRGQKKKNITVILTSFEHEINIDQLEKDWRIASFVEKMETIRKAEEAEIKGEFRNALYTYMEYMRSTTGRPLDHELLERIIKLASKLDPPPAIPEEAHRHGIRAQSFLKSASEEKGFSRSYDEFEKAIRIAPWWADAHFNYALALEAAEESTAAIRSYKMFLLAAPRDLSAREVRKKIYTLEAETEIGGGVKHWKGKWWKNAAIYQIKVHEDRIRMVYVKPTSSEIALGWQTGDVMFDGTVTGSVGKGNVVIKTDDPDVIKCYGKTYERDMTAKLGQDENTLTVFYQYPTFLIKTCEETKYNNNKLVFKRIP